MLGGDLPEDVKARSIISYSRWVALLSCLHIATASRVVCMNLSTLPSMNSVRTLKVWHTGHWRVPSMHAAPVLVLPVATLAMTGDVTVRHMSKKFDWNMLPMAVNSRST